MTTRSQPTKPLIGLLTFVAGTIAFVATLLFVFVTANQHDPQAVYLVNAFGFFVGLTSIFFSFYLQFGPRTSIPLTPTGQAPARAVLLLFWVGAGVTLLSLRIITQSDSATLFWRVVGYSVLLAVVASLTATYVVRAAPSEDPIVEPIDDGSGDD